jgi:hypothetical protein
LGIKSSHDVKLRAIFSVFLPTPEKVGAQRIEFFWQFFQNSARSVAFGTQLRILLQCANSKDVFRHENREKSLS